MLDYTANVPADFDLISFLRVVFRADFIIIFNQNPLHITDSTTLTSEIIEDF